MIIIIPLALISLFHFADCPAFNMTLVLSIAGPFFFHLPKLLPTPAAVSPPPWILTLLGGKKEIYIKKNKQQKKKTGSSVYQVRA